jgi:hypothetical protein
MNTKPGDFLLKATLLLVVLSLFLLLTTLVFGHEVTWDITFHSEESLTTPIPIGAGFVISVPISLDAQGAIQVVSPTNVVSTVTIPGEEINGFSHIFAMSETGKYVIRETYTLVFRSLDIIISEESFTNTDEWEYDNSTPSLMLFRLEDIYVDDYSASISPSDTLEIQSITPSPGRPSDTGQIEIKILRDIQAGETIDDVLMTLTAEWHKVSSLTPVPDNEPPSISHTPVQSVIVGFPIAAQMTDNLKVDSATLYFKDASSSKFQQILMTPTGEPDTYEGYIPITAEGDNGSYYFKASDPSGNETTFPSPESPYNITVVEQMVIKLRKGWNLFSICLDVEDSISSVLEPIEGSYESVWTLGSWKQYFPDDPDFPGGLDVITHGKGYWIDMKADNITLAITGKRLADTTILLKQGWNLVGYNYPEAKNVEDAQLFTPGDNTAIYTYEAGVWKKYHAGDPSSLNDLDQFKPGKGYYIYVATPDRKWVISP